MGMARLLAYRVIPCRAPLQPVRTLCAKDTVAAFNELSVTPVKGLATAPQASVLVPGRRMMYDALFRHRAHLFVAEERLPYVRCVMGQWQGRLAKSLRAQLIPIPNKWQTVGRGRARVRGWANAGVPYVRSWLHRTGRPSIWESSRTAESLRGRSAPERGRMRPGCECHS